MLGGTPGHPARGEPVSFLTVSFGFAKVKVMLVYVPGGTLTPLMKADSVSSRAAAAAASRHQGENEENQR